MHDLKIVFDIFCVFNLFLKNILFILSESLCFCSKKKTLLKSDWLVLFTFSLHFFPIRSLFYVSSRVTLPTDKKLVQKKTCVLVFSFAQFFEKKKRQKHSFLFENIILFSPFSILFQTRKTFLRTNTFKIRAISFLPL